MDYSNYLHYTAPAENFETALPLGNGRLGAMVYGGVCDETVSLNEDTLWTGYPVYDHLPESKADYARVRQLVKEGKYGEAQVLAENSFARFDSATYLPLGDLKMSFEHHGEISDYKRDLDLMTAVAETSYKAGGVRFTRRCFVSHPHDAVVYQVSASKAQSLNFTVSLKSRLRSNSYVFDGVLFLDGECPSSQYLFDFDANRHIVKMVYRNEPEKRGIQFRGALIVTCKGGEVIANNGDDVISVHGAREATVYFKIDTSFNGYDKLPFLEGKEYGEQLVPDLQYLSKRSVDEIFSTHLEDYSHFYNRVKLDLGQSSKSSLPTDERLAEFAVSHNDPSLYALLFNYGRYLTICGSREGAQPMNLQGIWNDKLFAPWRSNYTTNINTEMNYWPTEAVNLPEMTEPLLSMIRDISVRGVDTARSLYGAEGFCAHHNVDLWRKTTPPGRGNPGCARWMFWPMSAAWLCRHLWEHYEYHPDNGFLAEIHPILKEACRFLLSTMDDCADGKSVLAVTSPENGVVYNGERVEVTLYATMTNAIIRDLFENTAKCCELMGDAEFAQTLRSTLAEVCPYKIGSRGQLLEYNEEYEEQEPHHRHISHLYGAHPADHINPDDTPELMAAVRRSLELRGDDGTGWSLGWKINQWARQRDGEHALQLLNMQLRPVSGQNENYTNGGGTYPNLFDAHPPFQIDGNFGATSGICEMLLQSRGDRILLLPALPSAWKKGSVSGLRAKGGIGVDVKWGGKTVTATLTAENDISVSVRLGDSEQRVTLSAGEPTVLNW